MNIPPDRVVSTGRRAPRTPCAANGCPFLCRATYCPLHNRVDPVPDTDATQNPGVSVTEPRALLPWRSARNPWQASASFPRCDPASAPAAGEQLTEPIPGGTPKPHHP